MEITLPQWLDTLIFDELKAQYRPQYSDMTNIDDDKKKTWLYLDSYLGGKVHPKQFRTVTAKLWRTNI